jgi:ATP-dependent protease Clp ATPase subunit
MSVAVYSHYEAPDANPQKDDVVIERVEQHHYGGQKFGTVKRSSFFGQHPASAFCIADATACSTEAGYVGEDVEASSPPAASRRLQ